VIVDDPVGLDTGIFERVLSGHDRSVELFERLTRDDHPAFVSCISLYEITKLQHREVVNHEKAD
jgi:PIN domain nuclease of toxin-antitoxin system